MRLHRFYVEGEVELKHNFWTQDPRLVHQWRKVLRFQPGQNIVLFNDTHERLYTLESIDEQEAHLELITDYVRKTPEKDVYLLWSLLKKDKNDWVLQKCTELGVSHFIPLIADRSEKTGFNIERAQKIVIEAAEQCGRSDIPSLREPMHIETALQSLKGKVVLFICEQDTDNLAEHAAESVGVLIGPEGGWSDREKSLFTRENLPHINLGDFTLRAETAAVSAATHLLQ